MKTTSINILNLCVPCYNHCRYCLLSWNGKCLGIEYTRSVEYARNFYNWLKIAHPDIKFVYYFGYSMEHPDEDCDINLAGLINVLENCRKYKVKTVLFSSSAAVYGENENIPLREDAILRPISFYGLTKMTAEYYIHLYHKLYGINAVVFRFANVYGERQGEGGEGGVVSIFCKLLAGGKPVTVFGNGEQTRDFIYAGDVAAALQSGLTTTGCQTINVSTESENSVNQLLAAFAKVVAKKVDVRYVAARSGDIPRSTLANKRLKDILKITPQMKLQDGIKQTYQDYLKRRKQDKDE